MRVEIGWLLGGGHWADGGVAWVGKDRCADGGVACTRTATSAEEEAGVGGAPVDAVDAICTVEACVLSVAGFLALNRASNRSLALHPPLELACVLAYVRAPLSTLSG